jgi:dGTPase
MAELSNKIFSNRIRPSTISRSFLTEEFYSDKSRVIFCSSFRRMMQKAQVFSLETNSSVRNRLTHSLEVADIGRSLARKTGQKLFKINKVTEEEIDAIQTIVETACLIHDIGNPPFGHFGEEAIKKWFASTAIKYFKDTQGELNFSEGGSLSDFENFDGNPQGFRIISRLHSKTDNSSLNLTYSTILSSIKYPFYKGISITGRFQKKIGIFSTEVPIYKKICEDIGWTPGIRYFLAYLMELADDICYCLSDIADSFEKGIIGSRDFKEELNKILKDNGIISDLEFSKDKAIDDFSREIAVPISRKIIDEASTFFADNVNRFLEGTIGEIIEVLSIGRTFDALKIFARKLIYTSAEAQSIEVAGYAVVNGLLEHYGRLLRMKRDDFNYFIRKDEMKKKSGLDLEWRIFKQLSPRMLFCYKNSVNDNSSDDTEWINRAHLIVDYISGMTDRSALEIYQNFMGINLK